MRIGYYSREAWKNVTRYERAGISAVLIVAVIVSVMGLFSWVAFNINSAQQYLSKEMGILVFLKEGSRSDAASIAEQIKNIPGAAEVRLITREEALQEIAEKPDIRQEIEILGFNPLPDTIEVKTRTAFAPGHLKAIADSIISIPGVDMVDYGQESLGNITQTLDTIRHYVWVVGGAFTFIILVLAIIAFQMTFTDRIKDSEILQSCGASSAFIRAPILLESIFYGLVGSSLALCFLYSIYSVTRLKIENLIFMPGTMMGGLLLAGVCLSFLATLLESFRHIKLK